MTLVNSRYYYMGFQGFLKVLQQWFPEGALTWISMEGPSVAFLMYLYKGFLEVLLHWFPESPLAVAVCMHSERVPWMSIN